MNNKIKGLVFASMIAMGASGCMESSKSITLPDGRNATEIRLAEVADPMHAKLFSRYSKLMYDKGFRIYPSIISVKGSKTVTLKAKETNIQNGNSFSLHPMTLNGVKPLSCKGYKEEGYAIRHLECTYNKQDLARSMNKPYGPKEKGWRMSGIIVDESPNGTLSKAWKCSKKYIDEYYAANSNTAKRVVKNKANECVRRAYGINWRVPGTIEDHFTWDMLAHGNKHYRIIFYKGDKDKLMRLLSQ